MKDILVGQQIVESEIDGLRKLKDGLDHNFEQAVSIINNTEGRVVVTGIGKSGHVGRKIAATFASTGTPSAFVHPSEAAHGDLGMITPRDCVIAISKSGESVELEAIVQYVTRFSIPLIAITTKGDSTLARAAYTVLELPCGEEACPLNLAPTTSTTQTLALGDALAVAAMSRTSFSGDDFKVYHPGGALGQRLKSVKQLMHTGDEMAVVSPKSLMSEVIVQMSGKRGGICGVVNEGVLLGVITDGDIRRRISPEFLVQTATEIMTKNPLTIDSSALLQQALKTMNDNAVTSLFIEEGGRVIGVIHVHDILRAGVS
jgi:arabinose-5-phosphate isomerase